MVLPSDRVLELYKIIDEGTMEEKLRANEELKKIAEKEMEEEKKNPPPWGDLML